MDIEQLKEQARRFFLGRTGVHHMLPETVFPEVKSAKRNINVNRIRSETRVIESKVFTWSYKDVKGERLSVFLEKPKVNKSLALLDAVEAHGEKIISKKVSVREDTDLMLKIPCSRKNRVHYISERLKSKGILALFYPIVKDCVLKSVLQKESGKLYVWYNPTCKDDRGRVLCLVSEVGKRPPLSWKWM